MANLYNLKDLNISNNQLTSLGFSLSNMKNLKYINVYSNKFTDAYIADLSNKYKPIEFINDDCVFNTNYKQQSTDFFDSAGIHNYVWRAKDSEAIAVLENKDSILVRIGGCVFFEHNIELIINNEKTSILDTSFWIKKAISFAEKMNEKYFAQSLRNTPIELDKGFSTQFYRFYYIKDSFLDKGEDYPKSFIQIKEAGPSRRILIYGWGDSDL